LNGMGYWLKSVSLMLAGGAATGVVLLSLGGWNWGDRLLSPLQQFLRNPQPEPTVDIKTLVIQQIRNASELTTAVYTMQAVVPTSQDASLGGFVIGTTKLLYVAQGEVRAGVDLSQFAPDQVQASDHQVRIQLPPPRILTSKIDVNHSAVYDYNRGFLSLGPDNAPELQSLAQQEALKKVVTAACDNGILQQASDRAKLVVSQFLTTAGYTTVTVEAQPVAPATCAIQAGGQ